MLSQIFNLSGLLQFDHTLDQKTFILSLWKLMVHKPVGQFAQLNKVQLPSFPFGRETLKKMSGLRQSICLPAKEKKMGKLGNTFKYHCWKSSTSYRMPKTKQNKKHWKLQKAKNKKRHILCNLRCFFSPRWEIQTKQKMRRSEYIFAFTRDIIFERKSGGYSKNE